MDEFSFTGNADIAELESLYQQYRQDPSSVDVGWRRFFEGFDFARRQYPAKPLKSLQYSEEFKVINLITAYRQRGHYFTPTNPVRKRRTYSPTLDIGNFGLTEADLDKVFAAGQEIGIGAAPLKEIIAFLQQTYCHSIGVEFMYVRNVDVVTWVRERMEGDRNTPAFPSGMKKQILESISRAVGFEKFIHKKFPGFKSFSLEGGESLIPALEAVIERAAQYDYKDFVIGMPHRGRLNVLANILHKPYGDIFKEFEGAGFEEPGLLGDVKYHLGHSSDTISSSGKTIHLTLSPNPSHLEAVNPVVGGIARALTEQDHKGDFTRVLPVLIHGDAALAGQGIVYEIVQMSELKSHRSGGTIHFVVNNQLGFTTNYTEGRSSVYCTDVAKIIQSPIFHVNGDDVEAVVHTALLAMEYRHRFNKDVFIDLLCYRKYGHNESDEPRFTQPLLYKIIEKHPNPLEIYLKKLIDNGSISAEYAQEYLNGFNQNLEQGLFAAKKAESTSIRNFLARRWEHLRSSEPVDFDSSPDTAVDAGTLRNLLEKLSSLPAGTAFFRKTLALQEERSKMLSENRVDWATAELLAFGSLLGEGFGIRMSGQDVKRGTFSQRHAVLTAEDSEDEYCPLKEVKGGENFSIYNSLLSEYGVLGYEYGYAWASPDKLCIWEAQFGDFINGAQIIIDQYVCAAEEKWNVSNGLVILLPHGYEGQGSEHSSARLERFLAACAHQNIQVANCTTPANYFHLLRRQLHRDFRKPLVVFTPKSLLRHPACISAESEFTNEKFRELIDDEVQDRSPIKRVLLCSGKIYYELIAAREERKRNDVAIIRVEQLYPFPEERLRAVLASYTGASEYVWVQEEPGNMGAWPYISQRMKDTGIYPVCRPESGAPASGSSSLHKMRQQKIIDKAFGEGCCGNKSRECRMLCAENESEFIAKYKKDHLV
jgi:2-oxoglutarate dehydrogenase E1 component